MSRLIPLQQGIIYGPILSRRLGRSLGINLLPADKKLCSFDCVYCHFGPPGQSAIRRPQSAAQNSPPRPQRRQREHKELSVSSFDSLRLCGSSDSATCGLPPVREILSAVESYLKSDTEFEFVTLSGNGEPTLYPDFATLVPKLKELVRRIRPSVRLVLLSNSSNATDPGLDDVIALIDLPIFKLDAGDQATFEALNRPCPGIRIESIITGLRRLAAKLELTTQTMLVAGPVANFTGPAFSHWLDALKRIKPAHVQLYTTDRPVADSQVLKLSPEQLETVARQVRKQTGIDAQAY